jgi:zinc transport system substrate-binding protein
MKNVSRALLPAVLLSVAVPLFSSARLNVLTSIFPLREFAAAVAGERADVSLFLPPGAGVHTWQPRPGDIMKLASSDLFISVGAGLEPWLADVLGAVPGGKLRTLEVSRGLTLLPAEEGEPGHREDEDGHEHEHSHGPLDPHIWLDFEMDRAIVDKIVAELSAIDPAGAGYFRANGETCKSKLAALDAHFHQGLRGCAGKPMVVGGHAAFGYLARRYGLIQTALYGLSPDAQPSPRRMMKISDFCRRENVRTIFFETSVAPGLARALAGEIGGRVLVLYAGHNLTRDQIKKGQDFFGIMEENLRTLQEGLGCR